MSDPTFPESLVDLQRASTAAWVAVEAHRREVDADRRRTAQPAGERHEMPVLRPWTEAEDARHEELMAEVRAAAEALRAGIAEAGLDGGYAVTQGLHNAARAES